MITWIVNCLLGLCVRRPKRRPDGNTDRALFKEIVRLSLFRDRKHPATGRMLEDITPEEMSEAVLPVVSYVGNRNDCADFRSLELIALLFFAEDKLKALPAVYDAVRKCLTGFKFVITDPGRDSMCCYTENHQACFAASEMLIGQLFPNDRFAVDGLDGRSHAVRAMTRFTEWCELREKYGFSEFLSSNYLPIDVSALSMILMCCDDIDTRKRAAGVMDILMRCYAEGAFEGTFLSASGRDYPRNLMNSPEEDESSIILDAAFGDLSSAIDRISSTSSFFTALIAGRGRFTYTVPEELVNLAGLDELEAVRTYGLETEDYEAEGLHAGDERTMLMQLGSGALTNPAIIKNTYRMMRRYKLWHHDFLFWLRFVESPFLSLLGLMPAVSRRLNFFQNGMSLERASVHTYRNTAFKLSVLEDYHPGSSGAQKTSVMAVLDGGVSVYTNHPLRDKSSGIHGRTGKRFDWDRSPSYFGGYGIAPHAHGYGRTALLIYRLPRARRFLAPFKMLHYTHTFLPEELLDETELDGRYAFARSGKAYLALIGASELEYLPFDEEMAAPSGRLHDSTKHFDLVQRGRSQYWIYDMSDSDTESFDEFKKRIKSYSTEFDGRTLIYGAPVSRKMIYGEYPSDEKIN